MGNIFWMGIDSNTESSIQTLRKYTKKKKGKRALVLDRRHRSLLVTCEIEEEEKDPTDKGMWNFMFNKLVN